MFNYNSGETQSSIKKFEQMLKTNHIYFFDAQEFEDIIIHYLGFGENHLAKKALKMGLEQHPDCLPLLLLQSEILIIDEKFEMALQLLEYIEKLSPYDEEIALQKASIASKKGDHKTSIAHLHNALELSEDPIEIWNLLGMEHLLAEEFDEAAYFFKNCLEDNPEDYPSLYNLLYCYEQLDQEQEAIDALNKVLEYDPYCEVAWHQLGKILMKVGRMKEALSALDFAIISDDSFTGAYIEKGNILESMGRINEAIENYEIALNSNEPSAFIYKCIGRCHEQLGNTELAKQFYLKSIKLEPSNEKSWEALVRFFITQKNYIRAKFYIEQALETNSDSVDLWKLGLELYRSMKKIDKAIQSAQKLLELGKYNTEINIQLIDLLLEKKLWEEAHSVAEEAFTAFPKNRNLALRIAGLCFHLNRTDEGLYLLNPTQLSPKEKVQFSNLFPDFKSLLA
ncbi:MAG: tetratricopeptide repeat protein [Flavobacteriaceae bacterium]